ncbi:MAG: MFS transporter [Xanthomonadales bacterium]|nr:MFS transporter [Xanthomonadales bacterium]
MLLRLLQGLAVGGEFGAASTYVAEHAPPGRRGLHTAVIQGTGTLGLVLALLVVLGCRLAVGEEAFRDWGWRLPFLVSLAPLAVALYIRRRLEESPVFAAIRREGALSPSPLAEVLREPLWRRRMLVALLSLTLAQGVLWHAGQFYPLVFLQGTLGVEAGAATALMTAVLLLGWTLFPLSGWLADRLGRRPVILAGFALGIVLLFPAYHGLARHAAPAWHERYLEADLRLEGEGCRAGILGRLATDCARLSEALLRAGLPHELAEAEGPSRLLLAGRPLPEASLQAAEAALGPGRGPAPEASDWLAAGLWLLALMLPVAHGLRAGRGVDARALSRPGALHRARPSLHDRQRLVRRAHRLRHRPDLGLVARSLRRAVVCARALRRVPRGGAPPHARDPGRGCPRGPASSARLSLPLRFGGWGTVRPSRAGRDTSGATREERLAEPGGVVGRAFALPLWGGGYGSVREVSGLGTGAATCASSLRPGGQGSELEGSPRRAAGARGGDRRGDGPRPAHGGADGAVPGPSVSAQAPAPATASSSAAKASAQIGAKRDVGRAGASTGRPRRSRPPRRGDPRPARCLERRRTAKPGFSRSARIAGSFAATSGRRRSRRRSRDR